MVERDDYYAEARTWSADVNGALRASRNRARWVAVAAVTIAILEAVALVVLMPLKTVVPYVIMVDRQTGIAEPARGVARGPLAEREALTRSALAQYVTARETLDATDLAANYRKVGLWSAGSARRDYLHSFDRANPASILNRANAATQIQVTLRSIMLLDKGTALVRFATDRRDGDGPVAHADWATAISYGYSDAPLGPAERLLNPLGFQVTRYRRDAETLPATVSGAGQ